jgi:hypothetical protein
MPLLIFADYSVVNAAGWIVALFASSVSESSFARIAMNRTIRRTSLRDCQRHTLVGPKASYCQMAAWPFSPFLAPFSRFLFSFSSVSESSFARIAKSRTIRRASRAGFLLGAVAR